MYIAPCVVDHGVHTWLNLTTNRAERWFRCAEFMEDLPHQFKGGQYDGEEEKKEDEYIYGYDSTVIQEAQIKWLQDVVAMGRDPETKK